MASKKRPRADLLSSLDAAFASTAQPAASKYTAQAAAQAAPKGNKQQAYQHPKRKRKGGDKKRDKSGNGQRNGQKTEKEQEKKKEAKVDPLYEKMHVDLLAVGLKDCSLQPQAKELTKTRTLHETFKKYLESVTHGTRAGSNAVDSLKNKVLSLDNPFKTSAAETAEKAIAVASKKQTAKLLSARRCRELGLHLLTGNMKYGDARLLNEIWTKYVCQIIESELGVVQDASVEAQRARNVKLQAKLKYLDLSGCPLEVIQSQNPCNVGLKGIIVAETQQTVQICCPAASGDDNADGPIRTLVKSDSRFKVRLDPTRSLVLDGAWFAERSQ